MNTRTRYEITHFGSSHILPFCSYNVANCLNYCRLPSFVAGQYRVNVRPANFGIDIQHVLLILLHPCPPVGFKAVQPLKASFETGHYLSPVMDGLASFKIGWVGNCTADFGQLTSYISTCFELCASYEQQTLTQNCPSVASSSVLMRTLLGFSRNNCVSVAHMVTPHLDY